MLLTNWKTTLAGLTTIAGGLGDMLTAASHGTITNNLVADLTMLATGIGLIFAKDATSTVATSSTTVSSSTTKGN